MKVVILAGGFGTRLSEHTNIKPKPMVEIGGYPILWHIMNCYAHHGFNEFVIALGYKAEMIKDYFYNYHTLNSDFTINLANDEIIHHQPCGLDWKVTLVDTGLNTMTGGRIKRLKKYLGNESFMLTYGDAVANIDIKKLVEFHKSNQQMVTVTAIHPKTHYGELDLVGDQVRTFSEKPELNQSWINGGFFVLEPKILDLIDKDSTVFEKAPLEMASSKGQMAGYKHSGFWQCMDTLRDMKHLNQLWDDGNAPWKVWDKE
jgi:glucose-1-phosphate cytidylyltransferase